MGKTTVAFAGEGGQLSPEDPPGGPATNATIAKPSAENHFLRGLWSRINAAPNNGVDDVAVRDLRERINLSPSQVNYRFYVIGRKSTAFLVSVQCFAQNARKTRRGGPPSCGPPQKFAKSTPTVLSRCKRHEFGRVPIDESFAGKKQKNQPPLSKKILEVGEEASALVARQSKRAICAILNLLPDRLCFYGREDRTGSCTASS
ncbi:hypothetical protein [Candidatus Villigracilis affinis]|uniref:hypothetical protein n=1 Tax=Candidatus Villigracilis affinis TaxID=3140682 RepID=UPI002A1DB1EE|nr:hypothetical protein [Anaerolineales bacterium]